MAFKERFKDKMSIVGKDGESAQLSPSTPSQTNNPAPSITTAAGGGGGHGKPMPAPRHNGPPPSHAPNVLPIANSDAVVAPFSSQPQQQQYGAGGVPSYAQQPPLPLPSGMMINHEMGHQVNPGLSSPPLALKPSRTAVPITATSSPSKVASRRQQQQPPPQQPQQPGNMMMMPPPPQPVMFNNNNNNINNNMSKMPMGNPMMMGGGGGGMKQQAPPLPAPSMAAPYHQLAPLQPQQQQPVPQQMFFPQQLQQQPQSHQPQYPHQQQQQQQQQPMPNHNPMMMNMMMGYQPTNGVMGAYFQQQQQQGPQDAVAGTSSSAANSKQQGTNNTNSKQQQQQTAPKFGRRSTENNNNNNNNGAAGQPKKSPRQSSGAVVGGAQSPLLHYGAQAANHFKVPAELPRPNTDPSSMQSPNSSRAVPLPLGHSKGTATATNYPTSSSSYALKAQQQQQQGGGNPNLGQSPSYAAGGGRRGSQPRQFLAHPDDAQPQQQPERKPVEYKPYTVEDYRRMKEDLEVQNKKRQTGLGPSDTDEQRAAAAKQQRQREYAEAVKKVNRALLTANNSDVSVEQSTSGLEALGPQPSSSNLAAAAKPIVQPIPQDVLERQQRRERALEFARNVPKPKPKRSTSTAADQRGDGEDDSFEAGSGLRIAAELVEDASEVAVQKREQERRLADLEAKHRQDLLMVQNMRRELKL